jgi:hypothetical protein
MQFLYGQSVSLLVKRNIRLSLLSVSQELVATNAELCQRERLGVFRIACKEYLKKKVVYVEVFVMNFSENCFNFNSTIGEISLKCA